ncbi:MAG TPA: hypothetical protein VF950_24385 [Planctomycetota bacterium]
MGLDVRRPAAGAMELTLECRGTELPRMSIVPLAGNVLSVELDGQPVAARDLRIDGPGAGYVQVEIGGSVRIKITAHAGGPPGPGGVLLAPMMVMQPRAANLISVLFRESRGVVIS